MPTRTAALLIVFLGLALGVLHTKIKQKPDSGETDSLVGLMRESRQWRGQVAPDVELPLLSGDSIKLSDTIGRKVIILNFFATWCGPCKEEMPELNRFVQNHRADPLFFAGVDAGESRETVEKFLTELKVAFPVAIDYNGTIQEAFGIKNFPVTVVIGVDGRVQLFESGSIDNADVALGGLIKTNKALLAQKKEITKEEYLKLSKASLAAHPPEARPSALLQGRAKQIAERMDCPCGCTQKAAPCKCQTAKKIRAKLQTMPLENQTDEAVIMALNKEFCIPSEQKDDH